MPTRRLTFPAVAAVAIASILLGALAALADGRSVTPVSGKLARPPATVVLPPACPAAGAQPPAAAPVPQPILDAFGVLRRERTPDDAVPDAALRALRARGLEPFDPAAARLLRRTDTGGRAWVVPVRDVAGSGVIGLRCILRDRAPHPARPQTAPATPVAPGAPSTPAPPATVPKPAPPAAAPGPRPPVPPAAAAPLPTAPADAKPRPGLAVVAVDGAPAGAGGRLEDLVRGRADLAIDPCAGPGRNMMSLSGIVPDGVPAAFLTSHDGTAVRADVKDNAYAFVVPRSRTAERRYVVWTGGDGTPHVQPLAAPCSRAATAARAPRCSTGGRPSSRPTARACAVTSPPPSRCRSRLACARRRSCSTPRRASRRRPRRRSRRPPSDSCPRRHARRSATDSLHRAGAVAESG